MDDKDRNKQGITDDKLHHILGVARRCYEIAKEKGYSEHESRRMFMLGWVHDVGYEFCETFLEHSETSNELLKLLGADENFAVLNHGRYDMEMNENNMELTILNIADMTVDHKGNRCTVSQRLEGIAERFGKSSESYINAEKLAKKLSLI